MHITAFSPTRLERSSFGLCAIFLQLALWWAFAMFVDYEFIDSSSGETRENSSGRSASEAFIDYDTQNNCYHMFKDLRIMLFVGFGLLRVFQKSNGEASPVVNIIIAAVTVQWSVICEGVFHLHKGKIEFNVSCLLNAEMALAAVFISCGAVINVASPLQLIAMAISETAIFFTNKYLLIEVLQTSDTGASLHVHLFAAYFGVMVSVVLQYGHANATSEESSTKQNLESFFIKGTLFLWAFWPLFNASFADGAAQHRAVIHTYCAMSSCCTTVYAATSLFKKEKSFTSKNLLNATLAGGIAVGTAGDLMIKPVGALVIGVTAGVVSVLADVFYSNVSFCSRISLDTFGIHTTHGLSGLLAGLSGAVAAMMASEKAYSDSLYRHFPAMVPMKGTHEFWSIEIHSMGIKPGIDRTAVEQAGFQIAAIFTSLSIATIGGLLTGFFIRLTVLGKTSRNVLDDNQESHKEVVV